VDFFRSPTVQSLVNLKDLILGGGGIFALIRWAHRKRIESEEPLSDGMVTLKTADGDEMTVPAGVLELYQSLTIRKRVRQVLEPLEHEGVEAVRFISDVETTTTLEISKESISAYEVTTVEEKLTDNTLAMSLSVASVAFTEGNKWRLSDGECTFYAKILDSGFLARVNQGQEAFRKGDILACQRIEQVRREDGLHTDYTVGHVDSHTPAVRPLSLFDT
jgi:hypothetical protein